MLTSLAIVAEPCFNGKGWSIIKWMIHTSSIDDPAEGGSDKECCEDDREDNWDWIYAVSFYDSGLLFTEEGHCSLLSEDFEADLLQVIIVVRLFWFDDWFFSTCRFFLMSRRRLRICKILCPFLRNNNLRLFLFLDNLTNFLPFINVDLICRYCYWWADWRLYKRGNIYFLAASIIHANLLALHLHWLVSKIRVD